jgi:hypothetical protein
MYAGLTSIPFSYMSAAKAADAFNQQYAGERGLEKFMEPQSVKAIGSVPGAPGMTRYGFGEPSYGIREAGPKLSSVSPWNVATGRYPEGIKYIPGKGIQRPDTWLDLPAVDTTGMHINTDAGRFYGKIVPGETVPMDADIFTKRTPLKAIETKAGDMIYSGGETATDWLPTAASQAAALYGGMPTPEEEWEATKKKRIKELAFMYGVPEEMIEGEFDNPWNTGAFMNSGGIASLNMDLGGDVSGPGTGVSDSIDAKLSDGEFVMTAKAVENLGNGDRYEGARKMYDMMNMLDPESETMSEVV